MNVKAARVSLGAARVNRIDARVSHVPARAAPVAARLNHIPRAKSEQPARTTRFSSFPTQHEVVSFHQQIVGTLTFCPSYIYASPISLSASHLFHYYYHLNYLTPYKNPLK